MEQDVQFARTGEQERSLQRVMAGRQPCTMTSAPPTAAMMSRPDPSSVNGPSPRMPSAKIVGNVIEWNKPSEIGAHIATRPV